LAALAVAIFLVATIGYAWWVFAAGVIVVAGLLLSFFRRSNPGQPAQTPRLRWLGRGLAVTRMLLLVVLGCWLGLILWMQLAPGGPAPPAKTDRTAIRVVTWNVHCGQSDGPPWKQFDWPNRQHSLQKAVTETSPDILCVQEATTEQVAFLE